MIRTTVDLSEVEFASYPQRIAARIIDAAIVSLFFALFVSLAGFEVDTSTGITGDLGLGAWIWFLPVVYIGYEIPAIAARGQTLGKRIMGIIIVRTDGETGIGLDRSLSRFISILILSFVPFVGFLANGWYLFDPKRQNIPDKIARTFVIRIPDGLFKRNSEPSQDIE